MGGRVRSAVVWGWEERGWLVAQLRDLIAAGRKTDSSGAQGTGGAIWGTAPGESRKVSDKVARRGKDVEAVASGSFPLGTLGKSGGDLPSVIVSLPFQALKQPSLS